MFVHHSADGSMERICTLPEVERVSRWRACRREGMSEQLRALYSLLGARKHPRGAQEQIGADAVAALLMGGSGAALAASPPLASPPPAAQQASGATQASGAASGVAPDVPAAASSSAPAAAIPAAIAPQGLFILTDEECTRALWCGYELHLYNGRIWSHWHGCWYLLRGRDPQRNPYISETHWWQLPE